jgi:hypothetical protein
MLPSTFALNVGLGTQQQIQELSQIAAGPQLLQTVKAVPARLPVANNAHLLSNQLKKRTSIAGDYRNAATAFVELVDINRPWRKCS